MAYFSNSGEGAILDEQCCECIIPDDDPCPMLLVQVMHNYDQKEKRVGDILNSLINEDGQCQMKPILDKIQLTGHDRRR